MIQSSPIAADLTFVGYSACFEDALAKRRDVCITHLPNGAPVARVGNHGPSLAVVAGLHGDETSGPLALLEWVHTAPEPLIPPGVRLWLAPLLNDRGWDLGVREWDGLDLNRSFLPGRQAPEFLRSLMRQWRRSPPDMLLDYHDDLKSPGKAYIFRYTEEQHDLPVRMAQDLGLDMWDWTDLEEWLGCSELFARELGCTRCVTLEAPTVWPMPQRIDWNLQALHWSLEQLAAMIHPSSQAGFYLHG